MELLVYIFLLNITFSVKILILFYKNNSIKYTTNHLPSVKHTTRSDQSDDGFRTQSAVIKAADKIKRSLPSNSTKKKEAVAKFLKSFDPKDIQEMITTNTQTEPKRRKGINQSEPHSGERQGLPKVYRRGYRCKGI